MLLYPTETIYALYEGQFQGLLAWKKRDESQTVSWLVCDMNDVVRYAEVSVVAAKIAKRFLPGPLTLVLSAKASALPVRSASDDTISFRISSDPTAQKVVADFMA